MSSRPIMADPAVVAPGRALKPALATLEKRALKLAEDADFLAAFNLAARTPGTWQRAAADTHRFLEKRGVSVPHGLSVRFGPAGALDRPVPDFELFTIRLTRCRTYWLKKRGAPGFEKVQICLGFEIVPNPIPGGPIG